jgi:D-3-phosphoglycerate dehydrogenase
VQGVAIGYSGESSDALSILGRHVLVGLLTPVLGRTKVNVVNAAVLAEGRGIVVSSRRLVRRDVPGERIVITLETSGGTLTLDGGLLGDHHSRILGIDGYDVNLAPRGTLLILRNRDVPGVIGHVGTILGEAGLNIAEYHQARRSEGGDALAAVVLDGSVPSEVLDEIRSLPEVSQARVVRVED